MDNDKFKTILSFGVYIGGFLILLILCWLIFRAATGDHESFRHIGVFGEFDRIFEWFEGWF